MASAPLQIALPGPEDTGRLGAALAHSLKRGDLVALAGDLGAGKTSLARAAIRALAGDSELDVPSPTFTLVQSYALALPVTHCDLYRIGSPAEVEELGLDEALEAGAVLVEWPEKGGDALPEAALTLRLSHAEEGGRTVAVTGKAEAIQRLERSMRIADFLDGAGWRDASRAFLLGDASTRAYETVTDPKGSMAILMNAPKRPDGPPVRDGKPYSQIAHLAELVTAFVAVAKALTAKGFSAPKIFAQDLDAGLVLLEHLGADTIVDREGAPIADRYVAAAELLAEVHQKQWDSVLSAGPGALHMVPAYDRTAMMIEVELLTDWYLPYATKAPVETATRNTLTASWNHLIDRLEGKERTLVLRDYHSPNIIWRDARNGHDRIGIIDFQDAVIGPSAYDVASLAQDARVTIPAELERRIKDAYVEARRSAGPFDREAFEEAYAIMAAQRNSKILGIFVRLNERDGKPVYLKHLPRIRDYVARTLAHPVLKDIAPIYRAAGIVS